MISVGVHKTRVCTAAWNWIEEKKKNSNQHKNESEWKRISFIWMCFVCGISKERRRRRKKHCRAYDAEVEKEQKGTLRMNLLNINNNLFWKLCRNMKFFSSSAPSSRFIHSSIRSPGAGGARLCVSNEREQHEKYRKKCFLFFSRHKKLNDLNL